MTVHLHALQQKRDLEMTHNELENYAMTAVSELSQCKLKISQVYYCSVKPTPLSSLPVLWYSVRLNMNHLWFR